MHRRFFFAVFIAALLLTVCLSRIVDLMILQGEQMRAVADENRLFTLPILAARGVLLDRDGHPLVTNIPQFYVATSSAQRLFGNSWSLSQIPGNKVNNYLVASPSSVFLRAQRSPTIPPSVAHVIGYTGYSETIDPEPLNRSDVRVGRTGLEKVFEDRFRGEPGKEIIEISAKGVPQRTIVVSQPPQDGQDVQVAIDRELSDLAYESLAPNLGSVIVSDVPTGQVLVLTSSPSYSNASLSAALKDPNKPLINRALSSYPPGSTFKLMTAMSALEAATITKDTVVEDTGELKLGTQIFGNWYWRQYGRTEGKISLTRAIARSNDIYFYKAAESVGPDRIDEMAKKFGFGKSTGIELPAQSLGVLPNSAWKEKQVGEKWYTGDTYNLGIGQGYLLATPVQVQNMIATIARRGSWCPLTLMLTKTPLCTDIDIHTDQLETVIDGMVEACSPGGTAFPFFPLNQTADTAHKIACKTGTAEFGASINAQGHKRTHGWFTMFYPREKPKVVITVFFESTKEKPFIEGSKDAAPIALKVFEKWKGKYEQGDSRISRQVDQ